MRRWRAIIRNPGEKCGLASQAPDRPTWYPTLLNLIRAFLDICLFRRGPQDLPASAFLLYLTLVTHTVSGFLLSLGGHSAGTAALAGITDTALLALLTLSLLYINGRGMRVPQTLSALAGCGTVIGILALIPSYWMFSAQARNGDQTVPVVLLLVLIVWSLIVMGHIIRYALSTRMFVGVLVAVIFYWIALTVQNALFPLPE